MPEDTTRDDADAPADSDDTTERDGRPPAAEDGISRRWLIRALVGLGIGIPVLVEARTLFHLVAGYLFGDGAETETTTRTTSEPSTGIGDELLPATAPAETLGDAAVRITDDAWVFEVTVDVENTGDAPYTLELGDVVTNSGTRVAGDADSGRVPVGETATVDHEWSLPAGETPDTLAVAGVVHRESGDERVEETVRLGKIPSRG